MNTVVSNYAGKLTLCPDWEDLLMDDLRLSERVQQDEWDGCKVSVRYFTSETEISSIEIAEERFVKTLYGITQAEGWDVNGTEWTGQYSTKDTLTVGGHDLVEELKSFIGKFLFLEIKLEPAS